MVNRKTEADESLSDDEYEVENLLKHRFVMKRNQVILQYFIKWKGYGAKFNTWEAENDISADILVELYWSTRGGIESREREREEFANKAKTGPKKKQHVKTPAKPTTERKTRGASKGTKVYVVSGQSGRVIAKNIEKVSKVTKSFDLKRTPTAATPSPASRQQREPAVPKGAINIFGQEHQHREQPKQPEQEDPEAEAVIHDLSFRTDLSFDWTQMVQSVDAVVHNEKGGGFYGIIKW